MTGIKPTTRSVLDPAEEIRTAATHLRSLAEAACTVDGQRLSRNWSVVKGRHSGYEVIAGSTSSTIAGDLDRAEAEFIATMDPEIALAIANWMTVAAEAWTWTPELTAGSPILALIEALNAGL